MHGYSLPSAALSLTHVGLWYMQHVDKDVSPCLNLSMMVATCMDVICKRDWSQASQCQSPGAAILFVCCMLPVTFHLACINALQHQR